MFILIILFRIPHVNTTLNAYSVFTFSIVVYIPTKTFLWSQTLCCQNNGKSSCSVYRDTLF